jgi:hypothetical protein
MSSSNAKLTDEGIQPVAWRPKTWRRAVGGMSNSKFYEERKTGRIKTVKMGAATLVITSPKQYVALLRDSPAQMHGAPTTRVSVPDQVVRTGQPGGRQ